MFQAPADTGLHRAGIAAVAFAGKHHQALATSYRLAFLDELAQHDAGLRRVHLDLAAGGHQLAADGAALGVAAEQEEAHHQQRHHRGQQGEKK
ncbi:hypothetical protein [Pseudomonas aeruginosa]|uniref:hypothetical protein n=1 Tax=Pseudomonas aeruginosa TaxID=287 RepID=UPI00399B640D